MTIDPRTHSLNAETIENELEIPSWFIKLNKFKSNLNNLDIESQFYEQFLTLLINEETALELHYKNIKYIEKLENEIQIMEERYRKVMHSKLGRLIQFYWKAKRWLFRKLRGW
ncbi:MULTISPECIES: hypothetical protein [Bacillaceae]|uniref:hypothetical protein n=1 Tax=Bacillaceae TaxID=186817 RepID=UPI000BF3956C|nr:MULTISPECIES: hypothetical protein [Bacillaceae]PFH86967.1 hypothetical protein COI44_11395 [Bacillus sp. AFS088145]